MVGGGAQLVLVEGLLADPSGHREGEALAEEGRQGQGAVQVGASLAQGLAGQLGQLVELAAVGARVEAGALEGGEEPQGGLEVELAAQGVGQQAAQAQAAVMAVEQGPGPGATARRGVLGRTSQLGADGAAASAQLAEDRLPDGGSGVVEQREQGAQLGVGEVVRDGPADGRQGRGREVLGGPPGLGSSGHRPPL